MLKLDNASALSGPDHAQSIVYGPQIDKDLGITDRGRRKLIARGVLPAPDGYFGGRAFWTA